MTLDPTTTEQQLTTIFQIFDAAERLGLPLWLESGWAIDARLGRITRAHEDIDIAFPSERRADYLGVIESLGFTEHEHLDYGFLSRRGGMLLDSEPCFLFQGDYSFPDFPDAACPREPQGLLEGRRVRCLTWKAIYVEFLGYEAEVPPSQWRAKDHDSLRHVLAHIPANVRDELRARYLPAC